MRRPRSPARPGTRRCRCSLSCPRPPHLPPRPPTPTRPLHLHLPPAPCSLPLAKDSKGGFSWLGLRGSPSSIQDCLTAFTADEKLEVGCFRAVFILPHVSPRVCAVGGYMHHYERHGLSCTGAQQTISWLSTQGGLTTGGSPPSLPALPGCSPCASCCLPIAAAAPLVFAGPQGVEAFHCERCGDRTPATKHLRLHRFPEVLVLQIKRFKYKVGRAARTHICLGSIGSRGG